MVSKLLFVMTTIFFLMSNLLLAEEKCSKEDAQKAVELACKTISEKKEAAKDEIKKYRYCTDNYVWLQDSAVKMVMHPLKPNLDGKDLKVIPDDSGKFFLFIEFDKMAKASATGGWVDYIWKKAGAEVATPKTSFVKLCPGGLGWVAGSGIWK